MHHPRRRPSPRAHWPIFAALAIGCGASSADLAPTTSDDGVDGGESSAPRIPGSQAAPDLDAGSPLDASLDAPPEAAPEASAILGTPLMPDAGQLAPTPPMGWNSWNTFKSAVSDDLVRRVADGLVSSGMAGAGYTYVVIDDSWQSTRDVEGNIVPDATRFPDMKALGDYVHSKGLKFGIYSDRGVRTCGFNPGSYGREAQDAMQYAAWGVDFLKYDNCGGAASNMEEDYTTMRLALIATGRPIVYSIAAWWYYDFEPRVGDMWRTTQDIADTWASITSILDRNGGDTMRYGSCRTCPNASQGQCVTCDAAVPEAAYDSPGLAPHSGPNHWNDPDMLEVGNGGMTDVEYRSHFSMWAMMAAPLIASIDPSTMSAATSEILLNTDVIAVDQDPLGVQGGPIGASTTLEVWSKRLTGTSSYAVALLNRTDADAEISVAFTDLGIASGSASVRDLWAHADLGTISGSYAATVPSHGVVMLRVDGH